MSTSAVITVIGRLGSDPERSTDGRSVRLSVCVDGQAGPLWFAVAAWGQTATACEQFLKKGGLVQVIGALTAGAYVNGRGEVAPRLSVNAFNITFLDSRQQHSDIFSEEKKMVAEKAAPAQAYVPKVSFARPSQARPEPAPEPAPEPEPAPAPVQAEAKIPADFLDVNLWNEVK